MIIKPNWIEPFKVAYEYSTEIITSRRGNEQRIALRVTPRKSFEYKVLAHSSDHRRIHQLIAAQQHEAQTLAEVTKKVKAVGPATAGLDTITIGALPEWVEAGQAVFVENEFNAILSVTPSGGNHVIQLATPLIQSRPSGFRMFYAVVGYMQESQQVDQASRGAAQLTFKFNVLPGSENDSEPPAAAVTFNGREVFTKRPNWSAPPSVTYSRAVEDLDYGRGVIERFNPVPFGTMALSLLFLARDTQEADDIVNMFRRMRGRQGEFYMSTGLPDIQLRVTAAVGTYTLSVAGTEFADDYENDSVRKAVCVRLDDGTLIYNKLLSVAAVSLNSVLTFESPWPTTLTLSNVDMISWLPVWRFASDTLLIEWATDLVAQYRIVVQTLEDLAV